MADGFPTFGGAPSAAELAKFPRNDLGNALRLVRLVGGTINETGDVDHTNAVLLYLRKRGWIAFNGRFWDLEAGEEEARRWTHRVAAGLLAQAPKADGGAFCSDKEWAAFMDRTGSSGASAGMLQAAIPYLSVDLSAFDRDPLSINVRNGTLKFRRESGAWGVRLQTPHDPADRITRFADVAYDPAAARPNFDALVRFCQPRDDMSAFLKALFGYAATGSTKEQLFVILQGKGGDGKSTLVNAVREALGTYSAGAAVETFLDTGLRRSSEASPDLARLSGDTRLICTAEPPRGSKLASSAIKSFTGGGTVQARELRQGIFEFQPIGKVVLECNGRPQINDTDDGIWRRVRIVLFENQLRREDMDLDLPDKLKAEKAGILNWLVEGIIHWLCHGLKNPEPVEAALEDYRRGANPFAEWLADRVILDKGARVTASELYADYKRWMEDQGHDRPMSQTTFGRALGDLQIILDGKNGDGKKMRRGARLRTFDDPAPSSQVSPSGSSPAEPVAPEPGVDADALADWEAFANAERDEGDGQ